jgi:hypothetical protein
MARRSSDPNWDRASAVLRSAAKLAGWKVTYYGGGGKKQREWMVLEPPAGSSHRGARSVTMGYRRGDDYLRRGPYYRILAAYDQQERVPLP